jgi:hypothetical protein
VQERFVGCGVVGPDAVGRAAEKSVEKVKGSITQKSEAGQKKFNKGKANPEKELGF